MAIPDLNDDGLLPPGVHPATVDEIERRFGRRTIIRQDGMESFQELIALARRDDVRRIIVDGSFVTAAPEPNDVDCVLLAGPDFGRCGVPLEQWQKSRPFLHFEIADEAMFEDYVSRIFAVGRNERPKGMIEVIL